MSGFQFSRGVVGGPEPILLDSTSPKDIYVPSASSRGGLVHQLLIVNTDSTNRWVTIERYNTDTSTGYPITYQESFSKRLVLTDIDFFVTGVWKLRATAEIANKLYVHLTLSTA